MNLKKNIALLLIVGVIIIFFYAFHAENSLTINVKLKQNCDSKIFLISKSSTITHFVNSSGVLNTSISKIPKGKYDLLVLLYSNNKLVAKSIKIPLEFSYFTKIKVKYLKFDYIK